MKTFYLLIAIALVGCAAPVSERDSDEATIPPVGAGIKTAQALVTGESPEKTPRPTSEVIQPPTVTAFSTVALPTSTPKPGVEVKGGTSDLHSMATATQAVLVDRLYLSVAELSRERYLMDVFWDLSGQGLSYAVQGERSTDNMAYLEPQNWDWWRFDIASQQSSSLLPPTSAIDNEARHVLGLCTNDEYGAECGGVQRLWESPYGDWVIYHPVGRGEEAG